MGNVLDLQAASLETPEETKQSIQSWLFCGGTEQSNRSRIFC